jgi:CHAT domain-containing protein
LTGFYKAFREKGGKAKALQAALRDWLVQNPDEARAPYFWADLVLIGEWR